MKLLRAAALLFVAAPAGFVGAHALASESPPLVANCVNAADGWAVEVLGIDCVRAGRIVKALTVRRPTGPARARGMSCTVGYSGKIPVAIRCSGPHGSLLRANAYLPQKAKAPQLPKVARCSDYVDKLGRRWTIRHETFGCLAAADVVAALATRKVRSTDDAYKDLLDSLARVTCQAAPEGALPRAIGCGGWVSPRFGSPWPAYSGFVAQVKPTPPPSATGTTTTVRRP